MTCFPCGHPGTYEQHTMAWFKSLDQLCETHTKELEAMKPPPKIYKLKTEEPKQEQKTWLPKQVDVPKDYTEREPGEEG